MTTASTATAFRPRRGSPRQQPAWTSSRRGGLRSRVIRTTSFSGVSKPMSARPTSLNTTRSAFFVSSILRFRSRPSSPCSAPNATSTCPSRFCAPKRRAMSSVGASSTVHAFRVLRPLARKRLGRPIVGDRGGKQQHVDIGKCERGVAHRLCGRRRNRLDAVGRRDRQVRCEQDHLGAAAARLLGQRDPHPPRRAVAEVAHAVERLARSACGDEHAATGQRPGSEQLRDARRDLLRLRHAADAPLAFRHLSFVRADELDAPGDERLDVRARRSVRPHARVHRRRDEHRAAMRECRLGEDIVGDAVRELRERVRGARRNDQQVGARQVLVDVVALRRAAPVRGTSPRRRTAAHPA